MKKYLSIIAMAAAFVACTPEELKTSFDDLNASATITVSTVELATGNAISCPLTASAGSLNGQVVTLTGSPELAAQTVTVSATYAGKTYSESVNVAKLYAGGIGAYTCRIVVGEPVSEYTFTKTASATKTDEATKYVTIAGHDSHVAHDGSEWIYNNTDFVQPVTVDYTLYTGRKVASSSCNTADAGLKTIYENYVKAEEVNYTEEKKQATFDVSAWAMYQAFETRTVETTTYTIVATKGSDKVTLGAYVVKNYSSSFNHTEKASDDNHSGHSYEHGHGHGTAGNAGGGIVFAD